MDPPRLTARVRTATERRLEGLVAALADDDVFARRWREVDDVATLLDYAFEQGMAAVLLERMGETQPEAVARRRARDRLWHQRLAAVQAEVLRACAASVRAIALKGPLLGERLYPDPTLRQSTDLDLLVDPAETERARAVLQELGFQTGGIWRSHHLKFRRGEEPLELHTQLSSGPGTELPARPFVEAALPYRTARGETVLVLSPVDEFVFLAVHAARHRFERLDWLYDLQLLLEQHPDLDWDAVAERARSFEVLNAVSVAADALRRRLRTTLPDGANVLRRHWRVRLAAGFLSRDVDRLFFHSRFKVIGHLAYVALLNERPGAGLRYWAVEMGQGLRRQLSRRR